MTFKVSEAYFQKLLASPDPIEAVSNLSSFWANRMVDQAEYFGLSKPEWNVQLILIYTGEVANGGHSQFFLNRGKKHVASIISALGDASMHEHATILKEAATVLGTYDQSSEINSRELVQLDGLDNRFDASTTDVDLSLLSYLRDNEEYVLLPERRGKN